MSPMLRNITALLGFLAGADAVTLWSAPGAIPTTVPASCRAVLVQNITCTYGESSLVTAGKVANGLALVESEATTYCTPACYQSLAQFQANVDSRCGDKAYTLYPNTTLTQSGAALADGLVWAYNMTCLRDASGFCLPRINARNVTACSDCVYKYGAALLSSDYGRQKMQPAAFSSLLSSCGADPSSYPYSYSSSQTTAVTTTSSTTSTSSSVPTCAGASYTVAASDTCQSISKAQGVGTDLLISRNHLDYNCTSLTAGSSLCLQDKCTVHTLGTNETCDDVLRGQRFSMVQLLAWNPTIHLNCDNLASMEGRSICLSPPGGGTLEINSTVTRAPSPSLTSSLFSSWIDATGAIPTSNFTTSWYSSVWDSSATASITATAAYNTTLASELAQQTQYCWLTDQDFESGFDEDDYAAGCQALFTQYCFPTPGQPAPTSPSRIPAVCTPARTTPASTTASAGPTPTPYQDGMVKGCRKFYKVISGDTCQKVADSFSIDVGLFEGWNPAVGAECTSLFLGYYVCVDA